MSEVIISVPLNKPPYEATRLASKGSLLVAFRSCGYIGYVAKYHFAMHSSAWGWQGYLWNEEYGDPTRIIPVAKDAVWVHTSNGYLMHLQVGQNGEATIIAQTTSDGLLDADESGCLVKGSDRTIKHLCFKKDQGLLSRDVFSCEYSNGQSKAWFLQDGAIAIYDNDVMRLVVLSPKGDMVYDERVRTCRYYHPFVIRDDFSNRLYYTDDPRKEWRKSDALKVIRSQRDSYAEVKFFTAMGNAYYIAFNDSHGNIHLYRLSPQSHDWVEYVWGIKPQSVCEFARHDSRYICIISDQPISRYGGPSIPQNNGFLVWDSAIKAFHTDVPRRINIPKISAGRIPTVAIPDIWWRDIR